MTKMHFEIAKYFPKKDRLIGLDIGSFSIKLAQFAYQEGKPILLELKEQEITIQKDTQKAQLEALKQLFRARP